MTMELKVDPGRDCPPWSECTGIYVRAELNGRWGSYDIAQLDRASLLVWLRSRPNFAEQVVLTLLDRREERADGG